MTYFFFDSDGLLRSGWRALLFLFAFALAAGAIGGAALALLAALSVPIVPGSLAFLFVSGISSLVPAILLGWLAGRLFEKLPFSALGASLNANWHRHLLLGLAVGAGTLFLALAPAFAFGGLRFSINPAGSGEIIRSLAVSFAVFAAAAAFEEVLFRGYLLQTFARSGLAWLAVALTSVFFGLVHADNPNASIISTVNTVLAGLWFSIAYFRTRDLWFVWGLHLMWNWMQGSVFGIEVSGLTNLVAAPLLKETDMGPSWLTGQSYGIEGGIACTIAIVISATLIHFVRPKGPIPV